MTTKRQKEQKFQGVAAAPGIAHASAYVVLHGDVEIPKYSVSPEKREEEIARFEHGLMETRRQISAIRAEVEEKVGEEEASIFDAHQLVLEDRALIEDTITEVMESGFNIEHCFQVVANRYIDAFNQIDDEYIKERVSDIKDVTRRLICTLLGKDHGAGAVEANRDSHILVSKDVSPSETAVLELDSVKGIVTELGSRTSHSVIMARSLNIACVVGVHDLMPKIEFGDDLLIDGYEGVVYLNPSKETLERYGRLKTERDTVHEKHMADRHLSCETLDGYAVNLLLNVEGVETKEQLLDSGAEGIGLFRTENIFLSEEGFPDEEEQFTIYRTLVEQMEGKVVTIRTLDIGGDKNPHSSLHGYQEANPFMGFRGIRFCLEHIDVFETQLSAILRASAYGKVRVLYPMISNCGELIEANKCLESAKAKLKSRGIPFDANIDRGSMIEVPSAAVVTDLLAQHSDFFSIGTNDLIQYMLAVDRINDRIAHLYEPNHPAIMRTLNFIFDAGRSRNIPVSVCGELAGDANYAAMLIGMGASELSVSRSSLAEIKYMIRRMKYRDAKKLAIRVLKQSTPEGIKEELSNFYNSVMGA